MSPFGARTGGARAPNPLAVALAAARAAGRDVVDLALSNPTRAGLPTAPPDVLAHPDAGAYAPEPLGLASAREALAAALGPAVDPGHLVLTASTSEAYAWAFKLLCDPGDDVLVPRPCYPLVEDLARLEGVGLRPYGLPYAQGFHLDADEVARAAGPRTRAVLVVNPGSPGGQYLQAGELEALARVCEARGLALLSDEVFAPFAWGPDAGRVQSVVGRELPVLTLAFDGLSKWAGAPGLKLGWVHVGGPAALRDEALARLEEVADTFLSVGTPVQLALPRLLAHGRGFQAAALERVRGNRAALLAARPAGATWDVLAADGGWSAVVRLPLEPGEEAVCLRLLDAGVLVHPGHFYDFPRGAHLVLSLLPEPGPFAQGLTVLTRLLAEHAPSPSGRGSG